MISGILRFAQNDKVAMPARGAVACSLLDGERMTARAQKRPRGTLWAAKAGSCTAKWPLGQVQRHQNPVPQPHGGSMPRIRSPPP